MQYPYALSDLRPLDIRTDEDGDIHAVYDLPSPIPWFIKYFVGGDYWEESIHMVNRVRVVFLADEFTGEPYALVIPYGEEGKEQSISSVRYLGACSIIAVLKRLGYEVALSVN